MNTQNEDKIPAAGSQQDVAQANDAKAEATGTASDELSEDDLDAVAGGVESFFTSKPIHYQNPHIIV